MLVSGSEASSRPSLSCTTRTVAQPIYGSAGVVVMTMRSPSAATAIRLTSNPKLRIFPGPSTTTSSQLRVPDGQRARR